MRKSIIVCVWLFFFALPIFGGDKGFVSAGAGAVFPSDERFKDIYGTLHFSPELKAGYMFCENFYLWLGYSFFSATHTIPVLLDEATVNQQVLALGVGWEIRRGRLQSDFFAALTWAGFREQALDESFKASGPGFQLGTGLRYYLRKKIFLGLAFSYSEARVTLAETAVSLAGRRLLGGLHLTVNLGVRF
jgi:hypothetical protein